MTVSELIAELQKHDGSRIVVMSSDGEGNSHSPLYGVSTCSYRADSTYSGEIGLEVNELDDEARKAGYSEEDVLDDGVPAIVLSPTN